WATAHAQPLEEVPFITSPDNVTLEMLSSAGVKRGDHVIDLGSGDGRIVILAAKKFEATGLGVEIDPSLVEKSKANARNAGVADMVEFRVQDLFTTDLAPATVITMYLLPEVNLKLRPALLALQYEPADGIEKRLAELRRHIEENSEYVGLNFAAEARAMHEGDAPSRSIHGEARRDEARKLVEDGVPVAPLPFLPARRTN
ncbi:MAG: DUF1178 family protein, partial [Thermoleophilia bacterium]|nr:DUF1178 family protein [Thermoleophilia bacterium]